MLEVSFRGVWAATLMVMRVLLGSLVFWMGGGLGFVVMAAERIKQEGERKKNWIGYLWRCFDTMIEFGFEIITFSFTEQLIYTAKRNKLLLQILKIRVVETKLTNL